MSNAPEEIGAAEFTYNREDGSDMRFEAADEAVLAGKAKPTYNHAPSILGGGELARTGNPACGCCCCLRKCRKTREKRITVTIKGGPELEPLIRDAVERYAAFDGYTKKGQ